MKRVSADALARVRDADLLGLQESVRVYEWLEAHKGEPNNPVFQFVFRSYYRIDSAGLTARWKARSFEFLGRREGGLGTILEGLYQVPTARNVKSLQFSFATKLLHTLDPRQPIYDSKVAELLGLPVKKGKDFTANVDACVAAYDDLREVQRQLLIDEGVAHRVAALKARYDSRVSDE
ncbi:hypothetical protein [Gemmata sp.]|uniref:hypothetical protein n=1 Tax=Gemmata sp. TaxID=1914242 RepID=UPI003F716837